MSEDLGQRVPVEHASAEHASVDGRGEKTAVWLRGKEQFVALLQMIRFSHTIFALPFALLAAVMAWTAPDGLGNRIPFRGRDLLGILICMVAARSAAMAFNRIVDRKIDAKNPRTRDRHLPAGRLSLRSVILFTACSSLLFVAGTFLFWPNWLPLAFSLPVLAVLFGYSFTKRFTSLAHFWLGASLMLTPIAAWVALRGEVVIARPSDLLPALLLGIAVLLWVAGFDIIYACMDREFDTKAKLHSVPARFGTKGALRIAATCHAGMLIALTTLPLASPQLGLNYIYASTIVLVAALLLYEHSIISPDDLTQANIAFFNVNAIVSIGLCVLTTLDLLL